MNGQWFPNGGEAVEFLEKRIAERKREEPRRKFVEDHQLIYERKKNEPCIPILPGHDQEAWFARLDSNGIWERVFDFISSPSDLTSAYFSCDMFRTHLEEKRKMAMLSKVFEVWEGRGHLLYYGFGRDVSEEKKNANREILNQRLVSKSWKKSAEEVFLVPLKWTPQEPIWHPHSWYWHSPLVCCFDEISKVENAFEKLKNASSCESLLRVVTVDDHIIDDKETFYMKLAKFLHVHGSSVWGLSFINTYSNYDHLCQVLSSLLHLKALRLYSDYPHDYVSTYARIGQDMIFRNPLPIFPELVLGDLHCYCTKGEFLVAEILNKSPNLKAVDLSQESLTELDAPIPHFVWIELQNLRLEHFSLLYDSINVIFMDDVYRLQEMDWPLQFLKIILNARVGGEDLNCSDVVKILSRYNDSLIKFYLDGGYYWRLGLAPGQESVVVDLPNLKEMALPPIRSNLLDDDDEPDSSSSEDED